MMEARSASISYLSRLAARGRGALLLLPLLLAAAGAAAAPRAAMAAAQAPTSPGGAPEASPAPAAGPIEVGEPIYRLHAGDVLDVTVMDKPELTRQVTVLPDGSISYPYLGQMNVLGMTPRQLTDRLTAGLATQIGRPQVTVNVVKRQIVEASILGAVRAPGKRAIGDGWHILDLIADAGGLTVERPEWASATLVRGAGAQALQLNLVRILATGDPMQNIAVAPGDVLLIQEVDQARTHVEVLGEVDKPGFVPAPRDGSLSAVLLAVGGPTQRAALARASIVRGSGSGGTVPLDLSRYPIDGTVPDNIHIEPGDTLIIPQNQKVFSVLGAVGRPGTVSYPENQKVTTLMALTLAGGCGPEADLKHGELVRPNPKGGDPTIIDVDLERLLKKDPKAATKTLAANTTDAAAPAASAAAGTNGSPAQMASIVGSASNPVIEPGDLLFVPSRGPQRHHFGLQDAVGLLGIATVFHTW